ncbi:hypothetical protein A2851_02325 [Candidatus Kaiserbacteria bacterium RIFCSPHIGHO2_01_FULL_53_29]|uniref:GtrA/DPMS transmembrane domain-containing protein n=1 Tax=Candidatus Kaiserbacteria bacterium RIFCSPHIGHO2_01_FULL_53_29 TaxID=1798480 RepID=A0A1F6CX11_9BACT|nr:MAG: hypothetical protein A2851_02325 [Candidatus Kaiserbacteria bacterium RIFCSPHIGHO2_01_FULL_53_29]
MQTLRSLIAHVWPERFKIVRYIISGSTAAVTNIGTLYILTEFFHIWYLYASVVAVCVAMVVSFTLQKFWTFRDRRTEHIHRQAVRYFFIVLGNLLLNTGLVFCLVEYAKWPPVAAQFFASLLIAFESFFSYKFLVFHSRWKNPELEERAPS